MRTSDAVTFLGSASNLARALGIHRLSVYEWGDFPPLLRQYERERLSRGALRREPGARPQASRTWADPDARAVARWHRACQLKRYKDPGAEIGSEFTEELVRRDEDRWDRFQQRCVEQAQYRKAAKSRREFIKLRRIAEGKRRP